LREKECSRCNGTGWVTERRDDLEFAHKCDCQIGRAFISKSEKANIPKKFHGYELKTFFPHKNFPSQQKVIKIVQRFIDDFPAVGDKGLLFQGNAGVGKTRLLCTIANELINKHQDIDIYFMDWNDLVREMRSGEHHITKDFSQINQLIEKLAAVNVLLFDELGASNINDLTQWVMDSIYYIFNDRYNNERLTLGATNFFDNPKDGKPSLSDRVGKRIRSRLFEMTTNVIIPGKDRREP
jgi:DNA replication protein DnaC